MMTPQKTITIQVVENGFLVTNYGHRTECGMAPDSLAVYNRIDELQAQLPELLERPRTGPSMATPITKALTVTDALDVPVAPTIIEYAALLTAGGPSPSIKDRACLIRERHPVEGDDDRVFYWLAPRTGATGNKSEAHRYTVQSAFNWMAKAFEPSSYNKQKYSLELV